METNEKNNNLPQMVNPVQTEKLVETKPVEVKKVQVQNPVPTVFNTNCPGCNVKLKVDVNNKKLTLTK